MTKKNRNSANHAWNSKSFIRDRTIKLRRQLVCTSCNRKFNLVGHAQDCKVVADRKNQIESIKFCYCKKVLSMNGCKKCNTWWCPTCKQPFPLDSRNGGADFADCDSCYANGHRTPFSK